MPPIPEDRGEVRAGVGARTDTDGDTDTARTEGVSAEGTFAEARPAVEQVQAKADEPAAADEVQAVEEASALLFEDGVATEIAGLFYLINLMTSLDLPDCFEEDWRLASEVGAWGVLDAIARALLVDAPHLEADPVWRLLAVLAGREPDEPPGRRYARAGHLRLPESWTVLHGLEHATRGVVQQAHGVEELTLGVVQTPLGVENGLHGVEQGLRDSEQQRRGVDDGLHGVVRGLSDGEWHRQEAESGLHEGERHRQEAESEPLGVERGALTRWLDLVLPYLRLRLAQGLGLDPARPEDLPPLLLLHPGCVHVTSTHVDIVMDLASIALPVRISGLDRDPGWVPTFGRVVQFHFR